MKKLNCFFLELVSLFLSLNFTSCLGEKEVRSHYTNGTVYSEKPLNIPLEVSIYNDKSALLNAEDINLQEFTKINMPYNIGLYQGFLWVYVTFPKNSRDSEELYSLTFHGDPIDLVEAYKISENKWTFYARSGRGVKRNEITQLSNKIVIPVDETDFKGQEEIKLLLKTKSTNGSPVNVKLNTQRSSAIFSQLDTMVHMFLCGVEFIIFLLVFIYGIIYKDKLFLSLSGASIFFILYELELSGTGPVYLWNNLSSLLKGTKLIQIFPQASLFFFAVSIYNGVMDKESDCRFKQLLFTSALLSVLLIVLTVFLPGTNFLFLLNACTFQVQTVLLVIPLVANRFNIRDESSFFMYTLLLFAGGGFLIQLFLLIRLFTGLKFFMIFDTSILFVQDIFFLLYIASVTYLTAKKIAISFSLIQNNASTIRTKNNDLVEEKNFASSVMNEFINYNTIINDAFLLKDIDKIVQTNENVELVKRIAKKSFLLTQTYSAIRSKNPESEKNINLFSFFYACVEDYLEKIKEHGNTISVTASISDDACVYANPYILESIFTGLLSTVEKDVSSGTRFVVNIKDTDGEIEYKISFTDKNSVSKNILEKELNFDEEKNISSEQSKKLNLLVIKKALELYQGTLKLSVQNKNILFTAKMKLEEFKTSIPDSEIIESLPIELKSSKEIVRKMNTKKYIPDELFSLNGIVPVFLIVENNEVLLEKLKTVLEPHANIISAANGRSAFELLNELSLQNKIPDFVITELDMPLTNGLDFFKLCRDSHLCENIPFVLLLPSDEKKSDGEFINMGISAVLRKPFTTDQLLIILIAILNIKRIVHADIMSKISSAFNINYTEKKLPVKKIEESSSVKQSLMTPSQKNTFSSTGLSLREQQIALLIAQGKTDKQIADELCISAATVATHNKKLFKKLNVHSRIELMNKLK